MWEDPILEEPRRVAAAVELNRCTAKSSEGMAIAIFRKVPSRVIAKVEVSFAY